MTIANNKELYNQIITSNKSKKTFGDYAERLVCEALNIKHLGKKGEVDGVDTDGKKYEIKAFNLTIDKQNKQRMCYANGFGIVKKTMSISQQITDYCNGFDYLIIIEGNIEIKNLQVNILKDKKEIYNFLFDRVALCKENSCEDKSRFCYHELNTPFNHYQKRRYQSIIDKGYIL